MTTHLLKNCCSINILEVKNLIQMYKILKSQVIVNTIGLK